MTTYNFQWHDWLELVDHFNLKVDVPQDIPHFEEEWERELVLTHKREKLAPQALKKYLVSKYDSTNNKLDKGVRQTLNAFLEKLIEKESSSQEVFRAIRNVEDDGLFLFWFNRNLEGFYVGVKESPDMKTS